MKRYFLAALLAAVSGGSAGPAKPKLRDIPVLMAACDVVKVEGRGSDFVVTDGRMYAYWFKREGTVDDLKITCQVEE